MYQYLKNKLQNIKNIKGSTIKKIINQLTKQQKEELQKQAQIKHVNINQYILMIYNNIQNLNHCLTCNKQLSYLDTKRGKKYCSKKCCQQNIQFKKKKFEKIKNTMIQKYGVENPSLIKEFIQKRKKTNLQKYGGNAPCCSKQIFEKGQQTYKLNHNTNQCGNFSNIIYRQNAKKKFIQKYGVDNPNKIEVIKEKIKQTCILKYGGQGFQNQINSSILKKYYNNFKRYKNFIIPLFSEEQYINRTNKYIWQCVKCGNIFQQNIYQTSFNKKFPQLPRCLNCYPYLSGFSYIEKQILEFIKSIYNGNIIQNNRTIIKPLELDIVLPDLKLAIQFNGSYWHSNKQDRIDQNYHLNKTLLCQKNGYRLIHIFEYEWMNKQQIIKNKLKSIICNNEPSIYARKCIVKQISTKDKNQFLNNNHIQGTDNSSIKLGLFYQNELVAVMTFCKSRFNKNFEWQLSRYATSKRAIGGAGKLLKYFEQNYKPKSIITYADRRYSIGNLYYKLGFKLDHLSKPNYVWIKDNQILSRYQTQKHKLKKVLGNKFDQNLSEDQNMKFNGFYKIYDCGNYVFLKEY